MITTRPLSALATLLLAVVLPAGAAHAGELSPVDPGVAERPPDLPSWLIASRLGRPLDDTARDDAMMGAGLSDLGAVLLREAPTPPISSDPLTLRSSGDDSIDLRSLLGPGERWHLMSFGANANARPQEVKVTAYGAVAYLPSLSAPRPDGGLGFGPATAPGAAFGLGLDDAEEPVSLGFKGALDGLGLEGGAEYRSIGKRLERVVTGPASQKDREGTEVWLAQRLGLLRLKLSQSDLSDNVDRDPALPRTSRTQTAVSAQLAPRAWPIFGLTYATGDSERTWLTGEGRTRTIERKTFDSLAGSAYYGSPGFDLSGTSTYSLSRDPGRSDRDMTSLYHDLSLILRPLNTITVMPSVGSGVDRYDRLSTSYQSGSASLLLTYTPTASRWSLWTLGAYTASQSSDRTVDGRTMSVSGGLACGLGRFFGGHATVSVEAGYDRYVDGIYPESSSRGTFGLVLLKVASF
ncbi:MAG TPA: hypothetical protein VFO08_10540 [Methylomirabilota bacterium]|nr:hypothetical protein [Methylomirabilota bacterium]